MTSSKRSPPRPERHARRPSDIAGHRDEGAGVFRHRDDDLRLDRLVAQSRLDIRLKLRRRQAGRLDLADEGHSDHAVARHGLRRQVDALRRRRRAIRPRRRTGRRRPPRRCVTTTVSPIPILISGAPLPSPKAAARFSCSRAATVSAICWLSGIRSYGGTAESAAFTTVEVLGPAAGSPQAAKSGRMTSRERKSHARVRERRYKGLPDTSFKSSDRTRSALRGAGRLVLCLSRNTRRRRLGAAASWVALQRATAVRGYIDRQPSRRHSATFWARKDGSRSDASPTTRMFVARPGENRMRDLSGSVGISRCIGRAGAA